LSAFYFKQHQASNTKLGKKLPKFDSKILIA